jgi:peptidyl-dipeptidase A
MSLFRRARGRLLAPALLLLMFTLLLSCATQPNVNAPATGTPTVAEAEKFMADAEARLNDLSLRAGRASWVQSNFITEDTEVLAADTNKDYIAAVTELAEKSRRFDPVQKPEALARKFALLKLALVLPAPADPTERDELTKIAASMESEYGKGKWCPDGSDKKCLTLSDMEPILAVSRDPEELKRIWVGWHTISPPYRQKYARFVELSNKGAREMGFKDVGAMWRSNFDVPPDEFAAEMERLWQQVRPLYNSLYIYTRAKLNQKYGDAVVPKNGPIPAHLLGNMWSQEWGNIYDLLQPPAADPGYNLTEILKQRNTDPKQMVRYGEGFFTSLGFESLPATFWERSLFVKPAPGISTRRRTCASRCASRSTRWTSRPSTTSWGTTITRWPTPDSPISSRTAPTRDFTRPSATPSRSR